MKAAIIIALLFVMFIVMMYPISVRAISVSDIKEDYSYVYCYGNAKIWVYIETNESLSVGPNTNSLINFTVFLENLGRNEAVFINRITFTFGNQSYMELSPNVTLTNNQTSWSYYLNLTQENINQTILQPGESLSGNMNFDFRYDVIDSTGYAWSYEVNEIFPQTITSIDAVAQPLLSFTEIFVVAAFVAIGIAVLLILYKVRVYRKNQLKEVLKQNR